MLLGAVPALFALGSILMGRWAPEEKNPYNEQ